MHTISLETKAREDEWLARLGKLILGNFYNINELITQNSCPSFFFFFFFFFKKNPS
jgi:hypothetical protein